jgi:hypothetical protein
MPTPSYDARFGPVDEHANRIAFTKAYDPDFVPKTGRKVGPGAHSPSPPGSRSAIPLYDEDYAKALSDIPTDKPSPAVADTMNAAGVRELTKLDLSVLPNRKMIDKAKRMLRSLLQANHWSSLPPAKVMRPSENDGYVALTFDRQYRIVCRIAEVHEISVGGLIPLEIISASEWSKRCGRYNKVEPNLEKPKVHKKKKDRAPFKSITVEEVAGKFKPLPVEVQQELELQEEEIIEVTPEPEVEHVAQEEPVMEVDLDPERLITDSNDPALKRIMVMQSFALVCERDVTTIMEHLNRGNLTQGPYVHYSALNTASTRAQRSVVLDEKANAYFAQCEEANAQNREQEEPIPVSVAQESVATPMTTEAAGTQTFLLHEIVLSDASVLARFWDEDEAIKAHKYAEHDHKGARLNSTSVLVYDTCEAFVQDVEKETLERAMAKLTPEELRILKHALQKAA